MIQQALIEVVKNQLSGGVSEAEVREFLRRRGTDDTEIAEIFEIVSANAHEPSRSSVAVAFAPFAEQSVRVAVPEMPPILEPVKPAVESSVLATEESAPAKTEAHGVVRSVPPLQPTVPFAVANGVVPVSATAPTVQPVGRKRRILTNILLLPGIGGFLIGGWFIYSIYFGSPESQLDRMVANMRDVRSFAFAGQADIRASEFSMPFLPADSVDPLIRALVIREPVVFTTTVAGTYDIREESVPKLSATVGATSDKWPLGEFALDFEYRGIGQTNYFSFENLPDFGFLQLDFLHDKWFTASDSDIRAQLGLPVADSSRVVPVFSRTWRTALFSAWREHRFLSVVETFDSEDIEGVSAWHYSLAFDADAFARWAVLAGSIANGSLSDTEANALRAATRRWSFDDMQLWIGKRDGLPRKVSIRANVSSADDPAKYTQLHATLLFTRANEDVDIVAPGQAASFDEALQGLFGQLIGTAVTPKTAQERNDRRQSDVEAIADAIRKNMADNSGAFACTAGPLPARAIVLGSRGYSIESCLVPRYLRVLPRDPSRGTATASGYSVIYDPKMNKLTVSAPHAELGAVIRISK